MDRTSGDKLKALNETIRDVVLGKTEQEEEDVESEHLDELSKNLLRRYAKKAGDQATKAYYGGKRGGAVGQKRASGEWKAQDKIAGRAKVPATDANKGKRAPTLKK